MSGKSDDPKKVADNKMKKKAADKPKPQKASAAEVKKPTTASASAEPADIASREERALRREKGDPSPLGSYKPQKRTKQLARHVTSGY